MKTASANGKAGKSHLLLIAGSDTMNGDLVRPTVPENHRARPARRKIINTWPRPSKRRSGRRGFASRRPRTARRTIQGRRRQSYDIIISRPDAREDRRPHALDKKWAQGRGVKTHILWLTAKDTTRTSQGARYRGRRLLTKAFTGRSGPAAR